MLLTAGERISMALVAMAISDLGFTARSFTGLAGRRDHRLGARQGQDHRRHAGPHHQTAIDDGHIVIVAGFQGVSQDTKEITTLGRGGTDTTAVALAAALGAEVCEIYTDVDGVFTADPRIVPSARKAVAVTYEEMLELAACGAKILHLRCVEYARRYDIPIHVRSSFSQLDGTVVVGSINDAGPQEATMEAAIIAGVAHDRSEAKITVVGVPDKVGEAARIFDALARAQINLDMIVQNVSAAATNLTDISFTLPRADGKTAMEALQALKGAIGFETLLYDDEIGKVSLVGAGMRSHPGVTAKFFTALAEAGVNIGMISTSEIRISVDRRRGRRRRGRGGDPHRVRPRLRRGRGRRLRRERSLMGVNIGVVGATGQVGVAMRQILLERELPGRTRSGSSPPPARPAWCCRSATARSPSRTPPPPTPRGLDIAVFSAGATTSRAQAAALRRGGRHRRRQLLGLADGPRRPAHRLRGQPRRDRQRPQGHHRQPQLHDDGRDAGAQAAARRGRPDPDDRRDLPGRLGLRCRRRRRAGLAGGGRRRQGPRAVRTTAARSTSPRR